MLGQSDGTLRTMWSWCIYPTACDREVTQHGGIPKDDLTDIIASRVMKVDGKPEFHVRIGGPKLGPEGRSWFCAYEIMGPLTKREGRFGGEDAMQALVLTLYCISVDMEICAENTQGRLSWGGDTKDFGFPSPPLRSAPEVSGPR